MMLAGSAIPAALKTLPTCPETWVRVVMTLPSFSMVASCSRSRSLRSGCHSGWRPFSWHRQVSSLARVRARNDTKTWLVGYRSVDGGELLQRFHLAEAHHAVDTPSEQRGSASGAAHDGDPQGGRSGGGPGQCHRRLPSGSPATGGRECPMYYPASVREVAARTYVTKGAGRQKRRTASRWTREPYPRLAPERSGSGRTGLCGRCSSRQQAGRDGR